MFWHNLKYTLKILMKNKALIFWTFAFPIILGTFFHLAFQDIEKNEKLDITEIAIIENDAWKRNAFFQMVFQRLSEEGENKLFHITYTDEQQAKELLEHQKISGILNVGAEQEVIVKENGIHETILKYVTEEVKQTEKIVTNRIQEMEVEEVQNPEMISNLINEITAIKEQSRESMTDTSSNHLSYTMIEYYTLIAMTCLYGGVLGLTAVHQKLANMCTEGKRISISPTKKGNLLLSSVIASFLVQCAGMILLFLYTIFVLKVDYGDEFPLIVLLAFVGCFAGLSLGVCISSVLKTSENNKSGILLTITMLGCFLSGMMGITMKYIIDKNIPLINQINPANFITDGFYALYYYETKERFYHNIIALIIFSMVMIGLSIYQLRRQKYDYL